MPTKLLTINVFPTTINTTISRGFRELYSSQRRTPSVEKQVYPVSADKLICALDELERGIVWRYDQRLAKTIDAK